MRRAIIASVTAAILTISGLTFGPALRASALGETSVTLNCNDGTSLTLSVDANELAQLTAAVQGMIDYPAGLSCVLIQNPLPPTLFFSHQALAATSNKFVVDGGRWLLGCSFVVAQTSGMPGWLLARASKGPGLASRISAPLRLTECTSDVSGFCVFVNIGVNVHVAGNGTLEGTLNETIPEQTCPDGNGGTVAVGPFHFTSKPTPPNTNLVGCLTVNTTTHQAAVITYVTQISGLETEPGSGIVQGFLVGVGSEVDASFRDSQQSPSQQTEVRDMLNAPPVADIDSHCRTGVIGNQLADQQFGNINVRP
ncbi:MAG: hypothetical protein E6I57_07115 [Chloroflexi bacterium]|nr:MAG: hypothetical protein E6J49_02645 [Chloroflexota bacterium]TMB80845.1 MAG: hypothetical protein E6J52_00480 [Chloroflexota bacterium]TMC26880.1 MAG: hypothetical protein E6J27_12245 [Chloroflexota bacterium]TMC31881.1 MAG: hypothetical protein E6J24_15075 [Chloroflexota bacterium]TMC56601.1 MAG: hypothetical protein E6J19_08685 [Chloroflexota bacterium]